MSNTKMTVGETTKKNKVVAEVRYTHGAFEVDFSYFNQEGVKKILDSYVVSGDEVDEHDEAKEKVEAYFKKNFIEFRKRKILTIGGWDE